MMETNSDGLPKRAIPANNIEPKITSEIWKKRIEFAKSNYGKYPNSLILSRDIYNGLIEESEIRARMGIMRLGEIWGMKISVLLDHREKNIIKVAEAL